LGAGAIASDALDEVVQHVNKLSGEARHGSCSLGAGELLLTLARYSNDLLPTLASYSNGLASAKL
jgi:hypothetical protein